VKTILAVVLLGSAAAAAWMLLSPRGHAVPTSLAAEAASVRPEFDAPGATPAPSVRPPASQPASQPAVPAVIDDPDARECFRRGYELYKQEKFLEARAELSRALLSGHLPPQDEARALETLDELAEQTIFSGRVFDGDPFTFRYTVQSGDLLLRIERKQQLHVPPQFLLKVNSLSSAGAIRAGQTIKLVRGPVHAVVTKHAFTMDLYLQSESGQKAFLRRVKVGLGKDGSTPVGLWRVALGKKLSKAPWNPPPTAAVKGKILWGEAGYPLGKEGYWISLEGLDENTRRCDGYGIHGTNEPDSIGKEASLGCIRLSDPDIDLVYSMLYEKWSTVRIRP
jgi:hypothetical protein